MNEKAFKNIIIDIKNEVIKTKNKIIINANYELINMYFRLGKIISDNSKYGKKFITQVASSLKLEFPNVTGFSERNLWKMKAFYQQYCNFEKLPPVVAELPWTHNYVLIEKIKDIDIRLWYASECLKNGWSKTILLYQIETNLYERKRKSIKLTNFKSSIKIKEQSDLANNLIKDPYIFDFITLDSNYKEKELEAKMIEKIRDVLLELGKGFSFIGSQYKISTGQSDYYIDLLFYHLDLRCYIVVELKTTEFKPEYAGQIAFYVKAVDKLLKKDTDNETLGLLLCKEKDKLSVEWSLECLNVPVGVSNFKLNKYISNDILEKLPTEEDINLHININS